MWLKISLPYNGVNRNMENPEPFSDSEPGTLIYSACKPPLSNTTSHMEEASDIKSWKKGESNIFLQKTSNINKKKLRKNLFEFFHL